MFTHTQEVNNGDKVEVTLVDMITGITYEFEFKDADDMEVKISDLSGSGESGAVKIDVPADVLLTWSKISSLALSRNDKETADFMGKLGFSIQPV